MAPRGNGTGVIATKLVRWSGDSLADAAGAAAAGCGISDVLLRGRARLGFGVAIATRDACSCRLGRCARETAQSLRALALTNFVLGLFFVAGMSCESPCEVLLREPYGCVCFDGNCPCWLWFDGKPKGQPPFGGPLKKYLGWDPRLLGCAHRSYSELFVRTCQHE